MTKCIAFTGGGTGGHVIPGIAVMEALREKYSGELYWIGSRKGIERDILRRSAPYCHYRSVPTGKLRRYISLQNFVDLFRVAAGVIWSFVILLRLRPDVLFSKGGFVSVPPVFAAWLLRIPVITHESDVDPGLATRINSRFAARICVPYEVTRDLLPDSLQIRVVVTGNPVRRDLQHADAAGLKRKLGFADDKPLVFVFGGSLGSERINRLVDDVLDALLEHVNIVHQRGAQSLTWRQSPGYVADHFFYEDYPAILGAADLAVCRAGAGTLWELAATRTPGICIPLSLGASRGDQIRNADVFERMGTVLVMQEDGLEADVFLDAVCEIVHDAGRRRSMAAACERVQADTAVHTITDLILTIRGTEASSIEEGNS